MAHSTCSLLIPILVILLILLLLLLLLGMQLLYGTQYLQPTNTNTSNTINSTTTTTTTGNEVALWHTVLAPLSYLTTLFGLRARIYYFYWTNPDAKLIYANNLLTTLFGLQATHLGLSCCLVPVPQELLLQNMFYRHQSLPCSCASKAMLLLLRFVCSQRNTKLNLAL